jgi:hypothetical protein
MIGRRLRPTLGFLKLREFVIRREFVMLREFVVLSKFVELSEFVMPPVDFLTLCSSAAAYLSARRLIRPVHTLTKSLLDIFSTLPKKCFH